MISLLITMTAVSATMRVFPFLFSKWLSRWAFLEKLAETLPLCILILLIAHLLEATSIRIFPFALPEALGLAVVILSQIYFRTILLSMGAGVLTHQLTHYLMTTFS